MHSIAQANSKTGRRTGSLRPLPAGYARGVGAEHLARDLLGRFLVRNGPQDSSSGDATPSTADTSRSVLKIVETEAYLGDSDRASHAFAGRRSQRNASLYLPGGHWYVYFIYGLYYCLNVVAGDESCGEAVLIRAGVAVGDARQMEANRRNASKRRTGARDTNRAIDIAGGPGKLCQALAIDRAFDGVACNERRLYLAAGEPVTDEARITRSPRVGIAYAREARDWPLRFRLGN